MFTALRSEETEEKKKKKKKKNKMMMMMMMMIEDMHSSNGWQSPWHTQRGGKCCGWYSLPHTQEGGKCKTVAAGTACHMPERGQMRTERWWKPKEL